METVIIISAVMVGISCMMVNLLIAYIFWQHWHDKRLHQNEEQIETPEEKERRERAAEAQAEYEQGFINIMNYGGKPDKGE